MTERKQAAKAALLGWRLVGVCVISMIAATGLALLLIPQLSVEAAVRGATISIGVFLATRLGLWLSVRSRQGKP